MATTLAASAYFLTCCRPIHNSFCFFIEKTKLINFYNYPFECFLKHPFFECEYNHGSLIDHNLCTFNICTDNRAWSMDDRQKRQHFYDLICGRIPHCGDGDSSQRDRPKEKLKSEDPPDRPKEKLKSKDPPDRPKEKLKSKDPPVAGPSKVPKQVPSKKEKGEKPKEEVIKEKDKPAVDTSDTGIHDLIALCPPEDVILTPDSSGEKLGTKNRSEESVPSVKSEESKKPPSDDQEPKDVVGLTEDLIEKLDRNLRNLEATFDKFVKKNRDFITNLVECLDFEKQKQKSLEDEYNKLKQENEELKTQNDYLKMVNDKQLGLFKNELDRGISESKVIYKRKIHLMERQLQNDQDELQMYKQTEKQYMEVVEQDNEKIEKLNNKIEDLKNKEVQLVRNYLKLLRFLENVKEILSGADAKEIPQLRSLNTITDSAGENDPNVRRVLRNALNDGISTLNVRDLSILHDAIEDLNDSLCHQTDKCTKSPTANSSFPDFSSMNINRLIIEHSHEDIPKHLEDYDTSSNLSMYPTKQKPDRQVRFN